MEDNKNIETLENNGTAAEQAGEKQGEDSKGEESAEVKTFTQDEVNEIVKKRLVKQKESLLKTFENAQQLGDLEEREKNITMRELKAETIERLAAAGLPADLAKLVNYENKEACEESLKNVCDVFNASLGKALKIGARQSTPKDGDPGHGDPVKAAFGL